MTDSNHILIVDDDPDIRSLLCGFLHKNGYQATAVEDGNAMHAALKARNFDLVVLDIMLPGDDGLTLCRNLRRNSTIPIIMLTALGGETDRITGLETGADDYLPKPFNPRELLARIRGILRRAHSTTALREPTRQVRFAGWVLDTIARHLVSPSGVVVPLSSAEYRLLQTFVRHPRRILNRDQLLELTRGHDSQSFDRSIDVLVCRLRRHLHDDAKEASILKTVRGEGYVLDTTIDT